MTLQNLIKTSLFALALVAPLAACDGGDDDTTATSNNNDDDSSTTGVTETSTEEETGPDMEITCPIFCVQYLDSCPDGEFATNDECATACEAWDADGRSCRYQQVIDDMCDQAGNMGSSC